VLDFEPIGFKAFYFIPEFVNISIFCDIAAESLEDYLHFYGEIFCPHFQKTIYLHTTNPSQYKTKDSSFQEYLYSFL